VQFISKFIIVNTFIAWFLLILIRNEQYKKYFLFIISTFFTINLLIRSLCSIIYNLKYKFYDKKMYRQQILTKKLAYADEGA
jgi:hypothetical protein